MGRFQTLWRKYFRSIGTVGITTTALLNSAPWVNAQIISAQDSIQTQVVQQDNQFDIVGGTTADNGKLLFHSFEQFDLDRAQVAEFRVAPSIEAVFSRITNGIPSNINGAIELGGSSASLFLINPAGVLFGNDAAINLAGDFTVLTAERLLFAQGSFDISGDPVGVQGNILQLEFNPVSRGTIVNLGDLRVGANHSLSLIGHTVVNQGTLSGGAINVAAVGAHEAAILTNSLQFVSPTAQSTQTSPIWFSSTIAEHATAIEIGQDGTVSLTGAQSSELPLGTALVGGQLATTGGLNRIQVLGDHVATLGATLHAPNGGQIFIGGDYQGRGFLPTSQSTFIDADSTIIADGEVGGQVVVWSDGATRFRGTISAQGNSAGGIVEVSGKEHLSFGGQVDLRSQGTPGTLLLDPENIEIRAGSAPGNISASGDDVLYEDTLESAIIGDVNLLLQADNNITINPLSDGELTFAQGIGSITFLADADGDGQGRFAMAPGDRLNASGRDIFITAADIIVGTLDTSTFSAIDNIKSAGDIQLRANQGNIVAGNLTSTARGTLNNTGNGGDIFLMATGSITAGDIETATSALSNSGSAGRIDLDAQTGRISTNTLDASAFGNNNSGSGGNINLNAFLSIDVADITAFAQATINNSGKGGEIALANQVENITTASINASTNANSSNTGNGGAISLNAPRGGIVSQQIISTTISPDSAQTQGGDVQLDANGIIVVDSINASGEGHGGDINVVTQELFQAIDTVPNTDASLLTTSDGIIRLTYNSEIPFLLGNSDVHGTSGDIVSGSDRLTVPHIVEQTIDLGTIKLNNLFELSTLQFGQSLDSAQSVFLGASMLMAPNPASLSLSELTSTDTIDSIQAVPLGVSMPMVPSPVSFNLSELGAIDTLDIDALGIDVLHRTERPLNATTRGEQERATGDSELIWAQMERAFSAEFAKALELPAPVTPSLQTTQSTLKQVRRAQGITPALMYFRLKDTHIELVLVSSEGPPVYRPIAVTATELKAVVETFHQTITNPVLRPAQYLPAAQQLYDWLIRPMLNDLAVANIDHIGFILDEGLRSLPMAALHDGERFLIERYSIGLLPSVGLTSIESSLTSLSESERLEHNATLAMGIANFEDQAALKAVPLELELASQSKNDEYYLDHEATLDALRQRLENGNFTSLHLATHAVFQPGSSETSYVQLWDQAVNLNQLQELPLDAIDFLILSACATALGDSAAEFGFAGLAVNVGVQTALASLWSISDEGTLGLMSEFYRMFEAPLTRSMALRQAQLMLLHGNVSIVDGTLYGSGEQIIGHLPNLSTSGSWDFSHPAYWSGFTIIGNPW